MDNSNRYNPFLNHLIINKVISYTNRLPELKSLRLVSTKWNELVTPTLMRNSIVTLKSKKEMDVYAELFKSSIPHLNFHWKGTGIDLTDTLMKLVLDSAEELHISKGLITCEDLKEILECGRKIKTLSFNEVFVEKENSVEKTPARAKADSPLHWNGVVNQLTRLEVTSCDKDDNFPWNAVLPVLPNLRILHAQLQSTTQVTNLLEAMLKYETKLEEFSCFLVDMNEHHLELLACLEMPLKILDISLASSVTTQTLEGFLSSKTCKSLECFKLLREADNGQKNYMNFPRLSCLKNLEILGDTVARIFKSVAISCPNLESLNLSSVRCRDVMSQSFQHYNLVRLCIEECFFPTNVLARLSETFPNLKSLCLFLNDENVGVVFQKFENLEELTILGTEITDEGITGGMHLARDLKQEARASVGDCKRLRIFNLYPQPLPGITDASVHFGLLMIQELTCLSAPETAITNDGLRTLLRAKPNMVKLNAKVFIDPLSNEHFLRSARYQIL